MIYGYARISTRNQKLESQIEELKNNHATKIYADIFTGTKIDRPEFSKLMDEIQQGDTLIVTKLDRLARNTQECLSTIEKLFNQGVKIHILNLGIIDNSPTGQLIYTVFSAFAQFERDLIIARTQTGKEYARLNNPNFKDGRPFKFRKEQIELAYELRKQGNTYKEIEKKTGISIATQKRRFALLKKEQDN